MSFRITPACFAKFPPAKPRKPEVHVFQLVRFHGVFTTPDGKCYAQWDTGSEKHRSWAKISNPKEEATLRRLMKEMLKRTGF